jgi:TetR/AcrR family transcriptional regulator, transcriptional repressor for nem operon
VKEASRRVRAEALHGAAVSTVMRDSGLTHGGFYKHPGTKDDLLVDSSRDGFAEIASSSLARPNRRGQSRSGRPWGKPICEMCDYPERGCPLQFEQRRQQRDLATLQRKARSLGLQLVPAA